MLASSEGGDRLNGDPVLFSRPLELHETGTVKKAVGQLLHDLESSSITELPNEADLLVEDGLETALHHGLAQRVRISMREICERTLRKLRPIAVGSMPQSPKSGPRKMRTIAGEQTSVVISALYKDA